MALLAIIVIVLIFRWANGGTTQNGNVITQSFVMTSIKNELVCLHFYYKLCLNLYEAYHYLRERLNGDNPQWVF